MSHSKGHNNVKKYFNKIVDENSTRELNKIERVARFTISKNYQDWRHKMKKI